MRKFLVASFVFMAILIVSTACSSKSSPTSPMPTETEVVVLPTLTATPAPTLAPTPTVTQVLPLSYKNPHKYHVTYSFEIKNIAYSPSDIRVYLPVPGTYDAQQDLTIDSISPAPGLQSTDDVNGNSMAYWQLTGSPARGDTVTLEEKFTFTAYITNTKLDPTAILPYDTKSDLYKRYTQPEKYIESTDPAIVKAANEIAGTETNPYLMAKKFYLYILDNVEYKQLHQGLNGAKYLLTNRVGECGDYSALFIAFARAKGIPARPVVGYWAISGTDQTHVWAEFYLEGIGWVPVDATIGQQGKDQREYYFGNMDNQRVILSKEFNTTLNPPAPDGKKAPIMQVPMFWYWGSGSDNGIKFTTSWTVADAN
jgi:hypothetical protein